MREPDCSMAGCHPSYNSPPCSGGRVEIPNYYQDGSPRVFCAAHASWMLHGPFKNTWTAKRLAEITRRQRTA